MTDRRKGLASAYSRRNLRTRATKVCGVSATAPPPALACRGGCSSSARRVCDGRRDALDDRRVRQHHARGRHPRRSPAARSRSTAVTVARARVARQQRHLAEERPRAKPRHLVPRSAPASPTPRRAASTNIELPAAPSRDDRLARRVEQRPRAPRPARRAARRVSGARISTRVERPRPRVDSGGSDCAASCSICTWIGYGMLMPLRRNA